jgi:small subunit ribosomal protein S16
MVTIRLARSGAKKRPFYHITVADSRMSRDGRFIERIGFFNPRATGGEEKIRLDREKLIYWESKGAQVSARVSSIVKAAAKLPSAES